jgi:hypothetical protein
MINHSHYATYCALPTTYFWGEGEEFTFIRYDFQGVWAVRKYVRITVYRDVDKALVSDCHHFKFPSQVSIPEARKAAEWYQKKGFILSKEAQKAKEKELRAQGYKFVKDM